MMISMHEKTDQNNSRRTVNKKRLLIVAVLLLAAFTVFLIYQRWYESQGIPLDNDTNVEIAKNDTATTVTSGEGEALPDIDTAEWEFVLVNKTHANTSYPTAVEIEGSELCFDERALPELESMLRDCNAAGHTVVVNLAFTPYTEAEYYFTRKAEELSPTGEATEASKEAAEKFVARAGYNEHETGLAVDLTDSICKSYSEETINEETLAWLTQHCAEYGFIQRYPLDKVNITGFYEPYHFRYVGKEAAQYITKNGLCLEEFLKLYS
jgi:D-alanyl-D-alanine carboxypeptidase